MPDFPSTVIVARSEFFLRGNTQVFRSPLTNSEQVLDLSGDRWVAALTFNRMLRNGAQASELEAFLHGLRGASGTFNLWNHARTIPRGSPTGAPLIMGAGQTGTSVTADAWPVSTVGLLLPGDMVGIGGELKQVTATVDSDPSGEATVAFTPALRSSPVDNAPIVYTTPKATFRLADDNQARNRHAGLTETMSISCIEHF